LKIWIRRSPKTGAVAVGFEEADALGFEEADALGFERAPVGFERGCRRRVREGTRKVAGTGRAAARSVAIRDFRDLVCWRLSHALKCEVFEFTATGPASRDFRYRDQIRDSSASSPSNIAEAFGRSQPSDRARFCEFAIASLDETRNHLIDGRDRQYLAPPLFSRLWNLATSARTATNNWMFYLKRRGGDKRRRGNPTGATSNPTSATSNPTSATSNPTGAASTPTGATLERKRSPSPPTGSTPKSRT
jgi:four helix bundle protein